MQDEQVFEEKCEKEEQVSSIDRYLRAPQELLSFHSSGSSSKSPNSILGQLAELSDNICSLTGYDSSLLSSQISKILALATHDSKAVLLAVCMPWPLFS